MKALVIFLLVSLGSSALAEDFFKEHARGWHWYEDRIQEKPEEKKKAYSQTSPPVLTPTQKIEAYKKDLEQKLHQALVHPTPENVKAYMEAQIKGQEMAQRFSDAWMQAVYTHPHLDFTAKRPLNHVGRQILGQQEEKSRTEKLTRLAQTHGLFFFFEGGCPWCEAFAPVVKTFAQKYGFKVLAISLDGKPLPEFPTPQKDNGIVQKFGIRGVPVLLAVEPKGGNVIPLSHGFVSQGELETRATVLEAVLKSPEERRTP